MPVFPSVFSRIFRRRLTQIDHFRNNPVDVQQETLKQLIKEGSATHWGREHDYQSIKTPRQFQERVPLHTYDDLKPWIERTRLGESSLIWPGTVRWFAKSSGTTQDKSKFIPVSRKTLHGSQFQGAKDVLTLYVHNHPSTNIFSGKALTIGGSQKMDQTNHAASIGDLSAIMINNQPFWAEFFRSPEKKIALIPEWEKKLELITRETLKQNITSISGVPSWNLVLLKHLLTVTGATSVLDFWPNLELFIHGGISFTPYREQYKNIIPSEKMHYMETFNASEGFFAIQDDPSRDDMLLMLDYHIFYEFIPLEELGTPDQHSLTIGEVEAGKNYALVISTASGLWRYLIGDTIVFTSLFPHKIRITGRTKQYINAFGEELMVDNAEQALDRACKATHASIREYTAGPVYMTTRNTGAHEWLIEFEEEPDNLEEFSRVLDQALCSLNSDYEAKRSQNITLEPPLVRVLPKNSFYLWMKNKNKLGGQNKVPRLANHREFIDSLMETAKYKP